MSKQKRTQETEQEFFENPEVLAEKLSKTEEFLENNKNIVFGAVAVIIALVAGYFFFNQSKATKNEEAQEEMFQAVYYFEADSLDKALNGDGNHLGLLDVIDEYGSTKAGNLANFYVGSIYLKKGSYEDAITYLSEFASGDVLVQARAYSLIGDSHMELENHAEAADYYMKAAEHEANEQFSPLYLTKAGIAYEKQGNLQGAKNAYDKIVSKYVKSPQYTEARKQLAKVEGLLGG